MKRFYFLILFLAFFIKVTGADVVKLEVSPSLTDPAIRDKGTKHFVYVKNSARKLNKLFVFLPGTRAPASVYTKILETAAAQDYHAIGLVYENQRAVNYQICTPQNLTTDPDCHKNVRLENWDGKDRSTLIDINRANSIESRLIKLLQYLQQKQPGLNWNQFLSNGQLRWDSIALSGHSQGGGHAAIAGKIHKCYRIILFSSPEPADWTTETSKTPSHLYFGLVHKQEDIYRAVTLAWMKLRIPGEPELLNDPTPTLQSNQLVTSVRPIGPNRKGKPNYHGSVVADPFTPLRQDGVPELLDTWIYLLTANIGSTN